ncbi:MAG: ABC transporter ATP-binding protein/permease [Clostridiales bacterium]|nr:ABC transporter ATP-binding protein/permease [Clostridiales bacterium]
MVKLEHVNKYFNKRKKNEIHVIDDTSMEFPDRGLVALLGPSGSGKTTLLNVIGGLDKISYGKVYINGERITGRGSGKVDKIRNLNIGYIFQNYNLVDSMTVFDNVAIALRMVGVKDKEEIKEKVNYVLEKVGMYRYRNRYADMLSGGERQRVGIARAIVKNPAIVIADEPTGNLDSKNTLEIMNIIKSISQDKLVILVTHEGELADFYASRIVRLADGAVVSDEINDHQDNLDYRIDNVIYLKDIKDHRRLNTGEYDIDFYNETGDKVALDIVVRNGNIYMRTKEPNSRIEVVDDSSSVEFLDEHYREMTKEESLEKSFDIGELAHEGKRKSKSILNPWTLLKEGFRKVFDYNPLKKILLLGFLLSAIFITYSITSIFGALNITDDKFISEDKDYIRVIGKNISVDTYLQYEGNENYQYVLPGDSKITMTLKYDEYFQTMSYNALISGSLSDVEKLKQNDIIYGKLPENENEIVVDKMILKDVIDKQGSKSAGFGKAKDFVGESLEIPNMPNMTIVGISDLTSPCIYTSPTKFLNLLANSVNGSGDNIGVVQDNTAQKTNATSEVLDYNLKSGSVSLKKGNWPTGDYQVLVNEKNKEDMKIGKQISTKVNETKLVVSGYYSDAKDSDYMLVSPNTIKYKLISEKDNITISPKNKKDAMKELIAAKVNVKDTYDDNYNKYKESIWSSVVSKLVVAGVILAISFIEIFLIMRATFLSRVKEVGIYRAIGVKKSDIYKMFMGEILAITTLAGLPGFVGTAYVLLKISAISVFEGMFLLTPTSLGICLALVYGLNLIFGLIPVFRTIRKTPAAILSRTDVN